MHSRPLRRTPPSATTFISLIWHVSYYESSFRKKKFGLLEHRVRQEDHALVPARGRGYEPHAVCGAGRVAVLSQDAVLALNPVGTVVGNIARALLPVNDGG
ncbi:MAG: hypothetical protein Q9184_001204, partial [Pyrenodesmia sp. 2 TL-2023]